MSKQEFAIRPLLVAPRNHAGDLLDSVKKTAHRSHPTHRFFLRFHAQYSVFLIFRSSICTSCRFRTDMDRFCRPFCPLQPYSSSSPTDTALSFSLRQRYCSMPEAHTASLLLHLPYSCTAARCQNQGLLLYPRSSPRSDSVSLSCH